MKKPDEEEILFNLPSALILTKKPDEDDKLMLIKLLLLPSKQMYQAK